MALAHNLENSARTDDIRITQSVTFETMLLSSNTLEGLKNAGFQKPSPIQLHGIPLGKCGFDLLLEAKSGTGKTLVFSVIALEKLSVDEGLQVIILAPTREIAAQICDVIIQIGSANPDLVVEVVMGGLPFQEDLLKFKTDKKVHIVVGSPGRLRHLIQDGHINTSNVRLLILDEADKLMEQSFQADINYIFSTLPKQKQIIMSSATYPDSSKPFINNYMMNTQHVCPNSTNILLGISQKIALVKYNSNIVTQTKLRYEEVLKIITKKQFKQCLIFCNYQVRVNELYKMLRHDQWPAEQLHGQQEQSNRLNALKTLQDFKCRILISTDLAARGIDASNVDLVINFEPPFEWPTYLHRIGRAGRYGSYGTAITLLSHGKEEAKFKTMLAVVRDNLNISDYWTDKKLSIDSPDAEKYIHAPNSISIDSGKESNAESNYKSTTNSIVSDVKEAIELETFQDIVESPQGTCKIESFHDLLASFQQDELEDDSKSEYRTFDVKNTISSRKIESVKSNELNAASPSKDVLKKPVSVTNDFGEHSITKPSCSNILNTIQDESRIVENNVKHAMSHKTLKEVISHSDQFKAADYNNTDAFAEFQLPTSFSSTKYNNTAKSVENKVQYVAKIYNKNNTSSSECEEIHNVNQRQHYEKRNHKTEHRNRQQHYESKLHHNKQENIKNLSNNSYNNYIQWYRQLKFQIKQLEYAYYIEEMSK